MPVRRLCVAVTTASLACSAARPMAGTTSTSPGPTAASGPRALSPGVVRAELQREGAEVTDDGHLRHRYALDLRAGQRVRVEMRGRELDPALEVRGPDGSVVHCDDAFPGSLDAMVDLTAPRDGRYELSASTAPAGQTGRYELWVRSLDPRGDGDEVRLGEEFDRVLSPGEGPGGHWLHFAGRAGERVRLRVTSTAFDTVATVLGPGGERWFNDDANDLGPNRNERALDSTVELALPSTGVYHVVVGAYGGNGAGAFRLRSSVQPPVVLQPGRDRPEGGWAGPRGQGRVLGLYVGISDYPHGGDLYGCADDARFLGEAMRASRLQPASMQTVLTDAQATRAAVLGGVERLAAEATPEDLVMVFYSGHGNVQPAPPGDRAELDGVDETMVLVDGSITDTEFAAALGRVRAGTVILAMDSCHAGGFADDFVTAPGRVGLFSSDEDILSATAEPRRAGGYLSYWLRRAVLGEADARPRDGVLQAGELTDFVYQGFVTDHARMNPSGRNDPFQRLVVRRGAVPWAQSLWNYPRDPDLTLPAVPSVALDSRAPGG